MKLYTRIPEGLRVHFEKELQLSRSTFSKGYLGQAWPLQHPKAHWRMICFAFKKNTKEILGQIPRLLVGGVKSFIGEIPVGNTGGADVPPLKPMEIPNDLKAIIDLYPR